MRPHFSRIMWWDRGADTGIVDKDVDHPETAARLGDDFIDRLVAGEVGLDRHQIGALLPRLHRLGELGETFGGAVDGSDLEPRAEQTQDQFAPNAACRAGYDRRALLPAHRLLLSFSVIANSRRRWR